MSTSLQRLMPLFEREIASAQAMVLATVIQTAGPTYTKPGAQMLIARSGEYAGLLSGGCLEGDLSERAARVLDRGACELVRYDLRGPDDLLFGLGSGCEGAMDILLQRLDERTGWQPLRRLTDAWTQRRPERLLLMVPDGSGLFINEDEPFGPAPAACAQALRGLTARLQTGLGSRLLPEALPGTDVFLLEQPAPTRLLLLGAGPDSLPVAELSGFLGWSVTVIDHRSHYAQSGRFLGAEAVLDSGAQALTALLRPGRSNPFNAAIVMSHHLATDLAYLRALAASDIPYIGLLGPASRRDRLLGDLGVDAIAIAPRLRAPIGLDLGASSPEAIALSIVAEIQAMLSGSASVAPLSAKRACTDSADTPVRA